MKTTGMIAAFLVVTVSVGGCWRLQPRREFEPIALDAPNASSAVDYSGLAEVLKAAVSPGGEISADELKANSKMLEGQLMLMALSGPKTRADLFKDDRTILNYWLNARAAWSLRLMLTFSRERLKEAGVKTGPATRWLMSPDGATIEDFNNREFPIDSRSMTLGLIDDLLEKEFGFKAVIAAPCVCPLRAAIPMRPFETLEVGELIDKRFSEFIDDSERFAIDTESKRILVPPVLWRYHDRIIASHEQKYGTAAPSLTTALLPHVSLSPHRRLQDAVGYKSVAAPQRKAPLLVKRDED